MERRTVRPAPCLDALDSRHGTEMTGAERSLVVSGRTSTDADDAPMHPGDVVARSRQAWSSLEDAPAEADMTPANLVRLAMDATDAPTVMAAAETMATTAVRDGATPASTLPGVAASSEPTVMVELGATGVA